MLKPFTKESILFLINQKYHKDRMLKFQATSDGFPYLKNATLEELKNFAKEITFITGRKSTVTTKESTEEVLVRTVGCGVYGPRKIYEQRKISYHTLLVYPSGE